MQKTLNDDDKKILKRAAVVSPEGSFLLVRERERAWVGPQEEDKMHQNLKY